MVMEYDRGFEGIWKDLCFIGGGRFASFALKEHIASKIPRLMRVNLMGGIENGARSLADQLIFIKGRKDL